MTDPFLTDPFLDGFPRGLFEAFRSPASQGQMGKANQAADRDTAEYRRRRIADEKADAAKEAASDQEDIEALERENARIIREERKSADRLQWFELKPDQKIERLRSVIVRQQQEIDRIVGRDQVRSDIPPIDPDAVYL